MASHSFAWQLLALWLKGSTTALVIVAFALGYLFKVPLDILMSRAVSGFVILILLFWYVCSIWALLMYGSLVKGIKTASDKLGLPFNSLNYSGFKTVVLVGMVTVAFILTMFVYLWLNPPVVMNPVP